MQAPSFPAGGGGGDGGLGGTTLYVQLTAFPYASMFALNQCLPMFCDS
jgi:hypothetical protein